jgi:hypothetical protein
VLANICCALAEIISLELEVLSHVIDKYVEGLIFPGVALAISAPITEAVDLKKGHGIAQQYSTGLWCSSELAGIGLIIGLVAVRRRRLGLKDSIGGPVAL